MSKELISFANKKTWLNSAISSKAKSQGAVGSLYFVGREQKLPAMVIKTAPAYVKAKLKAGHSMVSWTSSKGPVWVISARIVEGQSHYGFFAPSAYAMSRDLAGSCFRQVLGEKLKSLNIEYIGTAEEEL
ncbi:MAG: hypothetical protein HRT44_03920, partial [Bdellovibrionales bacterium]|nr:hypothetical protein [Bdellovibrionales bacterium]NQZ18391.1 hypothetical protein [Bdellovibrionales bacterium]